MEDGVHATDTNSSSEEDSLWEKCNRLLQSDKKLTKPYALSTLIHITVLIFVTISTVNLANEKYKFRQFWIDLHEGYYLLLLKDYSTTLHDPTKKYVYTSQVKIMSDQSEVIDHLEFAHYRYNNIERISLGDVTMARNKSGHIIHPKICVTKQLSVNHSIQYDKECLPIFKTTDIYEMLHRKINSTILILIQFQVKQVYLVEGYKPICIQLIVHYSIENDFQHHLWPVRITVKGRLTNCSDPSNLRQFLPIENITLIASIGFVTVLVSAIGCVFHSVRIATFIRTGKMVRDYATKRNLSKPLCCCFLQGHISTDTINYIPLKAYMIFCPPLHILDISFLLLSISGVVLEFTVLRSATTTDELIQQSTVVSFILGLCCVYFWSTSFRLFNCSKLAGVTIRSLVSSRATPALVTATIVVSFAYTGITLLAWVTLGIFHPNFSTFRLSAETFYGLTLGDGLIPVNDNLLPQSPQYIVFVTSRVIISIYGLLFSIVLLSVIIAIVSVAVEEKWKIASQDKPAIKDQVNEPPSAFTWRVLQKWATTYPASPFPGTECNLTTTTESSSNSDCLSSCTDQSALSVTQSTIHEEAPLTASKPLHNVATTNRISRQQQLVTIDTPVKKGNCHFNSFSNGNLKRQLCCSLLNPMTQQHYCYTRSLSETSV